MSSLPTTGKHFLNVPRSRKCQRNANWTPALLRSAGPLGASPANHCTFCSFHHIRIAHWIVPRGAGGCSESQPCSLRAPSSASTHSAGPAFTMGLGASRDAQAAPKRVCIIGGGVAGARHWQRLPPAAAARRQLCSLQVSSHYTCAQCCGLAVAYRLAAESLEPIATPPRRVPRPLLSPRPSPRPACRHGLRLEPVPLPRPLPGGGVGDAARGGRRRLHLRHRRRCAARRLAQPPFWLNAPRWQAGAMPCRATAGSSASGHPCTQRVPLPPPPPAGEEINDQVQGGAPSYRNNLLFFKVPPLRLAAERPHASFWGHGLRERNSAVPGRAATTPGPPPRPAQIA